MQLAVTSPFQDVVATQIIVVGQGAACMWSLQCIIPSYPHLAIGHPTNRFVMQGIACTEILCGRKFLLNPAIFVNAGIGKPR